MTALANFLAGIRSDLESRLDWIAEVKAEERANYSPK
jgi:hypothetical protein